MVRSAAHQQPVGRRKRNIQAEEAREARTLATIIADLDSLPRENWLFIQEDAKVSMQVMCREVATDDFADEQIEKYCKNKKLKSFLYKDQLEDIISNLREQIPQPTIEELEAAIMYYWQHDAFISVS